MGEHPVKRRAVFLDRDGVLNPAVIRNGRPYPPASVAEFVIYNGVAENCARLKAANFLLVVVTNQPDVGRGTQSRAEVKAMHESLWRSLPMLDRIEVCWHAGEQYGDDCDCRKPRAGMLFRAAVALQIDLARSYLIGDRWRDVDCAHNAGCRAVFIDHSYEERLRSQPDFITKSFSEAVTAVLTDAFGNQCA
jgi:D-glycero-D-manno-heptose 1,7-bisphosphate phosphatase